MPRTKQVLAKRTQAERQNARHALGRLAHQVVAPKTEDRYFTSVSRFLDFLKDSRKRYPSSFILLDRDVCEFVEYLWEQGDPRSWASDCLSGLGHFIPSCKPYLVGSWRLHAAWGRTELPVRAPPFTPVLLYGLAQLAAENGWTDIAVLLILGFHTFARTGELFNARAGDFVLSATSGTWTLPLSKSGQRTGAVESILLTDVYVLYLLKNFIKGMQSGDRLSNVSPGVLRSRLASLLDQLHITDPYRWYSVRRGGATHAYRRTNNLAAICLRGRWGSLKTARIYICDGIAQLSDLVFATRTKRRLEALAKKCRPDYLLASWFAFLLHRSSSLSSSFSLSPHPSLLELATI